MHSHLSRWVIIPLFLLILVTACGGKTKEKNFEDFDPKNFENSTNVDNQWMPWKPGTRFVFDGTTVEDDGSVVPHRVVINVTDLTKVIGGVRSVVTWDLDYSSDRLVEAELAFFAQDKDGTVWRMGEYPEEYKDGKIIDNPTWIHGFQDAHAGIAMLSNPQKGSASYSQGWGPEVDWTDRGQVDQVGQKTCVPFNCYEDVLVIAETSQTEKGAYQLKYFARGLGNIRVDWKGEDQTQEKLELIEYKQLSQEELMEVRSKALELEKSAYENSKDVYGQTSPAEYPGSASVVPAQAEVAVVKETETPQSQDAAVKAEGTEAPQFPEGASIEVIVYASDLVQKDLSELEFWDEPASPGGKMIGIPNTGDELDPPPENDPHATFKVNVQGKTSYRCWIHMKVGAPKGKSQANVIWVQFTDAVDNANQAVYQPGTGSYLTVQGPEKEGWTWVACSLQAFGSTKDLINFKASGEITVRLQAGMEGVGFDQLLLSPALYLENPPAEAVVKK